MPISRIARVGRVARAGQGGLGVPPTVVSAAVQPGGASLVITMSDAISSPVVNSGWTLRATGGDLLGNSGDLSPGDGVVGVTTITFDSNSRAIAPGETLTLEYASASGSIVADATGLELVSFTGRSVTNNA